MAPPCNFTFVEIVSPANQAAAQKCTCSSIEWNSRLRYNFSPFQSSCKEVFKHVIALVVMHNSITSMNGIL